MLRMAQQKFKIFRLPQETKRQAKNRLKHQVQIKTSRDTWAVDMISTAICLASIPDWPIFTAALLGEKETFRAHCISAFAATIGDASKKPDLKSSLWTEEFELLWNLTQTTIPQVMALSRDKLTPSKNQIQLYKSLQLQNKHRLRLWMERNTMEPLDTTGWTSSLADAIRNATPNKGIRGRMSFTQQRLRRNGYEPEAVTNIGAVAIVNARATNIGSIIRGNTRNTWWLHEPNIDRKKIMTWACDRDNKIKTCRDNLPEQAYDTLRPIFDSNLVVVVIAAGKTPGRTKELKSERIIAKGGAPEHGTDAHDESAMDFTEELPPHTAAIHGHHSPPVNSAEGAPAPRADAQGSRAGYHTNNLAPKPKPRRQGTPSTSVTSVSRSPAIIGTNPTRIVMEGHSY